MPDESGWIFCWKELTCKRVKTQFASKLRNLTISPEELRFSAANEEEQGLWRLDTETLDFPSRSLVKKNKTQTAYGRDWEDEDW